MLIANEWRFSKFLEYLHESKKNEVEHPVAVFLVWINGHKYFNKFLSLWREDHVLFVMILHVSWAD